MPKNMEIKHLEKNFGKNEALKGIDLTIEQGEILGYIGPNGAGKSTTIRCILGLLKPSAGSIQVFGLDAFKNAAQIHEKIAYVPGTVYLWPNLTGGETIDMLLRLSNQNHSERTDQLIKDFDLDIRKKNHNYSKGNLQKVALIAAFSTEADLYIFDEPSSGLDPLNEDIFQENLMDLKKRNKSVLLSSHILSEVEKVADRIDVINNGKIIKEGSLEDLQSVASSNVNVTTKKTGKRLADLAGVSDFKELKPNSYEFKIKTVCLDSMMKQLNELGIVNISIQKPTLDQLFLKYYQVEGEK